MLNGVITTFRVSLNGKGGNLMPRGTYEPEVIVETEGLTEEEWLDYRRGGIGGSDVSIIYGVSHFRTGRELYYDKLKIKPYRDEEDKTWLQKEMGHALEDLVAKVFEKKTGLKVFKVKKMFAHPLYPFMRADVDFFIELEDGSKGILECKTTNYNNKDAWADEKYPYQYELQVRHYMAVMNLDFAYLACLWGNSEADFAYRYIERDYDFEDEIIDMEQNFWEEYVLKRVEPQFVEKPDLVLEALKKYAEDPDNSLSKMTLPGKFESELEQYIKLKDKKSAYEADARRCDTEIKRIAALIMDEMGAYTESELKTASGKKFFITYKNRQTTGISKKNQEKLKVSHKDVYDAYATVTESRTLRVKEWKVS